MEHGELTADEFRAIAREQGVSPRSLELWRSRGLLPAPTRQPKGRAAWMYPAESARQLTRLAHWRRQTRSLNLIAIALWIEGFPIQLDKVRAALFAITSRTERELVDEKDLPAFIEQQARKVAVARGKHAPPRVVRMKRDERVRACAYLLAVAVGAEDEIEQRKADVLLVERMFGLRSGQHGGLAKHEPFIDLVESLKPVMAPKQVRTALAAASDARLEFSRAVIHLMATWGPMLLPEALAEHGSSADAMRKLAAQTFEGPSIEAYAGQVIQHLLALNARQPDDGELKQALAELESVSTGLEMLKIFPAEKRAVVLGQLPPETRQPIVAEIKRRAASNARSTNSRESPGIEPQS